MENQTTKSSVNTNVTDEVKQFYKGKFKTIFFTLFKSPIEGTQDILKHPDEKAYLQSLIMYGSVFVLYMVGLYLLAGDAAEYLELSDFVKFSALPVVFIFLISLCSFGIKKISGDAELKAELLTGALCAIPLGLLIPILLLIKISSDDSDILFIIDNINEAGAFGVTLLFYLIYMLINILQQSLKASNTKDNIAFYASPLCIILSLYLTYRIGESFF